MLETIFLLLDLALSHFCLVRLLVLLVKALCFSVPKICIYNLFVFVFALFDSKQRRDSCVKSVANIHALSVALAPPLHAAITT